MNSLQQEIKNFVGKLLSDFKQQIDENPNKFRSTVIGTMRAYLPRVKPGRKAHPFTLKAVEIYEKDYLGKKEVNWHQIAKVVIPNYTDLSEEMRRFKCYQIRAAVHSMRYDRKSRQLRRTESI